MSNGVSGGLSDEVSGGLSDEVSGGLSDEVSRGLSDEVSGGLSDEVSRGLSDEGSRGLGDERRSRRDALFGPVAPPMDHQPPQGEGKQALFSAVPRRKGTIVVECSQCDARTPMPPAALGVQLVPSLWMPWRPFSRLMRCPACNQPTWCKVHWRTVLD